MKRIGAWVVAVALAGLAAPAAEGFTLIEKSSTKVRATLPQGVQLGGRVLQAGQYDVEIRAAGNDRVTLSFFTGGVKLGEVGGQLIGLLKGSGPDPSSTHVPAVQRRAQGAGPGSAPATSGVASPEQKGGTLRDLGFGDGSVVKFSPQGSQLQMEIGASGGNAGKVSVIAILPAVQVPAVQKGVQGNIGPGAVQQGVTNPRPPESPGQKAPRQKQ